MRAHPTPSLAAFRQAGIRLEITFVTLAAGFLATLKALAEAYVDTTFHLNLNGLLLLAQISLPAIRQGAVNLIRIPPATPCCGRM